MHGYELQVSRTKVLLFHISMFLFFFCLAVDVRTLHIIYTLPDLTTESESESESEQVNLTINPTGKIWRKGSGSACLFTSCLRGCMYIQYEVQ
jgi:hypothetical protein